MIRSVVLPNIPGNVSGHLFRSIWATTRCMKKAGWKFKGSSGEVPYVNRVFYSFAGLTLPRAQIDVEDAIVAGWPKRWLQLACGYDSYQSDQAYPALLLGGWDGSTVQHAM